MAILKVFLILVEVVCCFLLVGIILIQRSKNEGMGGASFGGGMGEQLFGSRTGNVLTRATIILACIFMATTTLLALTYSRSGQTKSILEKKAASAPVSTPVTPTAAPGPMTPAPAAPVAVPTTPVAAPVEAAPVAVPAPAPAPVAAPTSP